MGHGVPTMLDTDAGEAQAPFAAGAGLHVDGLNSKHAMASVRMPLPGNTRPMMSGQGHHGPIGMGGMLTLLKGRDHAVQGVLENGWYKGAGAAHARML